MNEIALIALWALPILFAITLHEAAHGYVARHFGDDTAARAGRITLNPLKHIDPVGTILVPLAFLLLSSAVAGQTFLFGWAKPVPVNFGNLRNPKVDMRWVAAAGPFVNLLMAVGWAMLAWLTEPNLATNQFAQPLYLMALGGVQINIVLMVLNLFPLPPLDGSRIVFSILPLRYGVPYMRLEPYGFPILVLLLVTGVLGTILWPFIRFFSQLLLGG